MKKPAKKRSKPVPKKRSEREKVLSRLLIARANFGSIMSKVCPPGAHHLSDTLDGVVKILTQYANDKYAGRKP